MGPGRKSMAIAVRLQPTAATLTDAEIEAVVAAGGRGRRQGDRRNAPRLTRGCPPRAGRARHGCAESKRWRSDMLKEFREFIARGNVMDLAVGIIIGVAFTAIVNSLVNDLINPLIGLITGGVDFSSHVLRLRRGRACRHLPLGRLHHRDHQLPDHRLGGLPAGQGAQQRARHGRHQREGARGAAGSDPGGGADRDPRPAEGAQHAALIAADGRRLSSPLAAGARGSLRSEGAHKRQHAEL